MRPFIAAANWKMNCTKDQAIALIEDLKAVSTNNLDQRHRVVLAVPFPYLTLLGQMMADQEFFFVAAQNVHQQDAGAFTGEVSAPMLKSVGVDYVIVGHSERRELFGETNELIKEKVDKILEYEMTPIFCCGEPLSIREAGQENQYVQQQLEASLFHLSPEQVQHVVIAYEPIWAIGTGKTATAAQAEEMHLHIRNLLKKQYGEAVADATAILYGGSVKADNAAELFSCPSVDGGLVGGASLKAADFEKIIEALKR